MNWLTITIAEGPLSADSDIQDNLIGVLKEEFSSNGITSFEGYEYGLMTYLRAWDSIPKSPISSMLKVSSEYLSPAYLFNLT